MKTEDIIAEIAKYADDHGTRRGWLAEKAGLSNSAITQLLAGNRGLSVVEYVLICEAFEVDFDYFINLARDKRMA